MKHGLFIVLLIAGLRLYGQAPNDFIGVHFKVFNDVQATYDHRFYSRDSVSAVISLVGKLAIGTREKERNTYSVHTRHGYVMLGAAPIRWAKEKVEHELVFGYFATHAEERVNFAIKDDYGSTFEQEFSGSKIYHGIEMEYRSWARLFSRCYLVTGATAGLCMNPASSLWRGIPGTDDVTTLPGMIGGNPLFFNLSLGLAWGFR